MLGLVAYFWDSYAIIELIAGNPNYAKYIQERVFITIYWIALREYTEQEADFIYNKYKEGLVNINDEVLKEAIKFRKEHKKKNLSYTDCIGYIYAIKNKLKFLTGDKEFENMPNVEFVK